MQRSAGSARWGIAAVLVCSLAPLAPAQVGSDPPSAANATYTLSGTVSNVVSGEPIRRAVVEIYAAGPHRELTDGSGNFEFDNLPPGQAAISVTRPGFLQQLRDQVREKVQIGPNLQP